MDILKSFLTIIFTTIFAENIVATKGIFLHELSSDTKSAVRNSITIGLTGVLGAAAAKLAQIPIIFNEIGQKQLLYAVGILFYVVSAVAIIFLYNYFAKKYSFTMMSVEPLIYLGFYPIAILVTVINRRMYFYEAMAYSIGCGVGLCVLELNMVFIKRRLEELNMPRHFKGLSINLIILGIISLGLLGLASKNVGI